MEYQKTSGFDLKTSDLDAGDIADTTVTGVEAVKRINSHHERRKLQDQDFCPDVAQFDRYAAELSAEIVAPTGVVFTNDGASDVEVDVEGLATIGVGERILHFTCVIDRSGSTTGFCEAGKTILDCEKEAILGLHAVIESDESAVDYGVSFFDSGGEAATFSGGSFVTTDRGSEDGDVSDAVNSLTGSGSTSFAAALEASINSIQESNASGQKYVVFLSDGVSNVGTIARFNAALATLVSESVIIFSFAVGPSTAVSCTTGFVGTLQEMANATGGTCTQVENAADLLNVLLDIISTKMNDVQLTIDGGAVTATYSQEPPFEGPGSTTATATQPLGIGTHIACITAEGQSPFNDGAEDLEAIAVECCEEFNVVSFTAEWDNENCVGQHSIRGVLIGAPDVLGGWPVTLTVTSGPNVGSSGSATTLADGSVVVSYTSSPAVAAGTDLIEVTTDIDGQTNTLEFRKVWDNDIPCETCYECATTTLGSVQTSSCVPQSTTCGIEIDKSFDASPVPQGSAQSFTVEMTNGLELDLKGVTIKDSVNPFLVLDGTYTLTGGSNGVCNEGPPQTIHCTVDIAAMEIVTLKLGYIAAGNPIERDGSPVYQVGKGNGSVAMFLFKNGAIVRISTVKGSRSATIQFPDGEEEGLVIEDDINNVFNTMTHTSGAGSGSNSGSGSGSNSGSGSGSYNGSKNNICLGKPFEFCLHLSCSNFFPNGFGKKGGPNEIVDADWQIAAFFIIKKTGEKNNWNQKPDKTCGGLVGDLDVPNTATATFTDPDAGNSETLIANDVITIEGPVCFPNSDCNSGGNGH